MDPNFDELSETEHNFEELSEIILPPAMEKISTTNQTNKTNETRFQNFDNTGIEFPLDINYPASSAQSKIISAALGAEMQLNYFAFS